jgi:hypothetical protein
MSGSWCTYPSKIMCTVSHRYRRVGLVTVFRRVLATVNADAAKRVRLIVDEPYSARGQRVGRV